MNSTLTSLHCYRQLWVFGSFDYLPYLDFKQNVTIFHNALYLYILIHMYLSNK